MSSDLVRARRLELLRDLHAGPATRLELDERHAATRTDLRYLAGLGLVTKTERPYPAPPLWAFRGAP